MEGIRVDQCAKKISRGLSEISPHGLGLHGKISIASSLLGLPGRDKEGFEKGTFSWPTT